MRLYCGYARLLRRTLAAAASNRHGRAQPSELHGAVPVDHGRPATGQARGERRLLITPKPQERSRRSERWRSPFPELKIGDRVIIYRPHTHFRRDHSVQGRRTLPSGRRFHVVLGQRRRKSGHASRLVRVKWHRKLRLRACRAGRQDHNCKGWRALTQRP